MSEPLTPEQVREALDVCASTIDGVHRALGQANPQEAKAAATLRHLLESGFVEASMAWSELRVEQQDPMRIIPVAMEQDAAYRRLQGEK